MATTKKKKNKKSKKNKEFIRNILIGAVAMVIVAFIINVAPGYKRDKYKNVINLVITDENVTEKLIHNIYINENDTIYMSKEDIANLIDRTIYYDDTNNIVITTSNTTTASMKIGEKELIVNGANLQTLDTIIYINDTLYIPISELETVYNIKIEYNKTSNIVVMDYLDRGIITAELNENTKMKYRPRGLSKKVGELNKSDRVYAFYTTSKGWRLIRTEDGKIGYVKANTLTNEYIVRQDMQNKRETKKVNVNLQNNDIKQIDNKRVVIRDMFIASNEGVILKEAMETNKNENNNIWATLSINNDLNLKDFTKREEIIKNIVSIAYTYKINGININTSEDNGGIERLIIELSPRLREMGISLNLILNNTCTINFINTRSIYYIQNFNWKSK